MSTVWFTRQGHRRVEHVVSDGRPYFSVSDPRYAFQAPDSIGWVPVFTRTAEQDGKSTTVFAPVTVAGLRYLGVELDDLVTSAPEIARRPMRTLPRITRRPGEPASAVQQKRYQVFLSEFTADVAAARGAAS